MFNGGFSGLYNAISVGFFLRMSSLNVVATNFSLIAWCDRGYYARPEKGIGIWSRVPAHANQSSLRPSHNSPNQSAPYISVSKAQKGIFNQEKNCSEKSSIFSVKEMDPADEIVAQLTKKYNEDSKQKKAVETVKKVLENILKHPHEEKYRFFS